LVHVGGVQSRSSSPLIVDFNSQQADADCSDLRDEDPSIEHCEPNYYWTIASVPNDPKFSDLWGMSKIHAPEAWDTATGSREVVVAVLDTGVDYNHSDLADNMWENPNEVPGNGLDDDGNGWIDDQYGIDVYNHDGDPFDDHGHGTHCAGTIGGKGNNSNGVAGVNWNVKIMALKFLGANGGGSTMDAIVGIDYARQMGVDVINASFGGRYASSLLEDSIRQAEEAGVLFVAAAGNNGTDNDAIPHYPSGFEIDGILSVGATDDGDALAWFSNFGASSVDVAAPGVSILSTLPNNGYGVLSGTSMAAPHVAGLAALVKSIYPDLTPSELKNVIVNSVDGVGGLSGKLLSGGRINAASAVGQSGGKGSSGAGNGSSGGNAVRILNFRGSKGKTLRSGSPFVARLSSESSQTVPLQLLLQSKWGSTHQCDLGGIHVEQGGVVRLRGKIPNSLLSSVTLTAAGSVSETRKVKRKKGGRQHRATNYNLESGCEEILSGLEARALR
ncbi:MAG: S8 family serine peptidase, partial [Bdellovibrionales bacterium]|nr:S8 family serine peptidase [Bdellovibrionales bacterium]